MVADRGIAGNLEGVRARVADAARRSGRRPEDVLLVAVSKAQPDAAVRAAYAAGQRDFGENRLEEATARIARLADLTDVRWHLIGHIQSRKAHMVGDAFALIHSVDRLKIAGRLSEASGSRRQPVLLEFNVSGETSKEGWRLAERSAWSSVEGEVSEIMRLPGIAVHGVMTLAPVSTDERLLRGVFRGLREWRDHLQQAMPGDWRELSMGMSDDYEWAIEEGATIVRIGRAIFGPRQEQG